MGVSLGREGLASAWELPRLAISTRANVCRFTDCKHNEHVVSLIREDATLLRIPRFSFFDCGVSRVILFLAI